MSPGRHVDECQVTLVIHADGHVVCLDDDCVLTEELHALVIPCSELDPHGCVDDT